MYFKISLPLTVACLILASCTPITKSWYEKVQIGLATNSKYKQSYIEECVAKQRRHSAGQMQVLGRNVNAPPQNAQRVFCTRIINAMADKRIAYSDYMKSIYGNPPPYVIRIARGK